MGAGRTKLNHFKMDLVKTIEELRGEKQKLDRAIAMLEQLQTGAPPKSRRGRNSMSAEERRDVSERMKKYWQRRRHKTS